MQTQFLQQIDEMIKADRQCAISAIIHTLRQHGLTKTIYIDQLVDNETLRSSDEAVQRAEDSIAQALGLKIAKSAAVAIGVKLSPRHSDMTEMNAKIEVVDLSPGVPPVKNAHG